MCFFKFTINWVYEETEETVNGIVPAESYADAMRKIANDYGEDNICKVILLEFINEGDTLEFDSNWNFLKEYL